MLTTDVPLVVPEKPISFDGYLVPRGLQPGENPLPEDESPAPTLPPLNDTAYRQLQEMGFPANRAEKALRTTGSDSPEVAMQWLFEHMDDPDIDVPFEISSAGGQVVVDPESVTNLMGMGFDEHLARKALQETVVSITYSINFCRVEIWNERLTGYFLTLTSLLICPTHSIPTPMLSKFPVT